MKKRRLCQTIKGHKKVAKESEVETSEASATAALTPQQSWRDFKNIEQTKMESDKNNGVVTTPAGNYIVLKIIN